MGTVGTNSRVTRSRAKLANYAAKTARKHQGATVLTKSEACFTNLNFFQGHVAPVLLATSLENSAETAFANFILKLELAQAPVLWVRQSWLERFGSSGMWVHIMNRWMFSLRSQPSTRI